jgi:hypothetical protein
VYVDGVGGATASAQEFLTGAKIFCRLAWAVRPVWAGSGLTSIPQHSSTRASCALTDNDESGAGSRPPVLAFLTMYHTPRA